GSSASLMLTRDPIGGLVSGHTYYVVSASPSGFPLAAAPSGTALTPTPASYGTHVLYPDRGALPVGTGTQAVRLGLGGPSPHTPRGDKLLAPSGVSLRLVSPPAGSGQSSASAQGGSGGILVGVSVPTASLTLTPTVHAHVDATRITAGGNVSIAA